MNNIYSPTPEQSSLNPESERQFLIAAARYGMQKGLIGLYPQMSAEIAAEAAIKAFAKMNLVERPATVAEADTGTALAGAESALLTVVPTNPTSEMTILDGNEVDEVSSREAYMQSLKNNVNDSYIQIEEGQRAA